MNLRKIVIAIDGYSACGKSSTAKVVANVLGYRYIDTGAMYRAVTFYFLEHHVALTNPKEVSRALQQINMSLKVNAKNITERFSMVLMWRNPFEACEYRSGLVR